MPLLRAQECSGGFLKKRKIGLAVFVLLILIVRFLAVLCLQEVKNYVFVHLVPTLGAISETFHL